MDATLIHATAAHLQQLGLQRHQIERHVQHLNAIAATRARRQPKPKQPRPVADLSGDQIVNLISLLRMKSWRWASCRPQGDAGDWVGHAVAAAIGQTLADRSFKADLVVGDALRQLQALGLIERLRVKLPGGGAIHVVRVVRSYRVRLQPDERHERAASAGGTGVANGKAPAGNSASERANLTGARARPRSDRSASTCPLTAPRLSAG